MTCCAHDSKLHLIRYASDYTSKAWFWPRLILRTRPDDTNKAWFLAAPDFRDKAWCRKHLLSWVLCAPDFRGNDWFLPRLILETRLDDLCTWFLWRIIYHLGVILAWCWCYFGITGVSVVFHFCCIVTLFRHDFVIMLVCFRLKLQYVWYRLAYISMSCFIILAHIANVH